MTDRRISEIYRKVTLDMLLALVVPWLAAAAGVALGAAAAAKSDDLIWSLAYV